MASLLDKLPSTLVLAVLVGIFIALRSHVDSTRLRLWTTAWLLVFVHFLMQLFQPNEGGLENFLYVINFGSLQLAAIFFNVSLTSFVEERSKVRALTAMTAIPVLLYAVAFSFDWPYRAVYIACLAVIFLGTPAFVLIYRERVTFESVTWMPAAIVTGGWAMYRAYRFDPTIGFLAILTFGFALPGVLFWMRHRRWSPGIITSSVGFLLWGAVFPLSRWMATAHATVPIPDGIWNTPKFFVAFGMILTLLEDKSALAETADLRGRRLNEQLQRFASITSRLLVGTELNSLCQEIALAISETSTFRRVSIVLSNDGKTLYPGGSAGMDAHALEQIRKNCAERWRLDDVVDIFNQGTRLGEGSRLLKARELTKYDLTRSDLKFTTGSGWEQGDRVFVPLQSTRGAYVGCISMDDPRDVSRVTAEEMSQIELLANDLAVTIDNAALHRQLVRSEKLAAIGQLVAGVAHELNNPLASIVGYAELLGDEVTQPPSQQKLEKLVREAQRMKRIIENLLRFARQNNLEKKSANLEALLQDVLALREYHIRKQGVDVQLEIEPNLPMVALDEDQFKQILLNLLNNSMDALEHSPQKRISINASRQSDRIVMRFEDSGPGFNDVNRAFDPFYTTKPVGKGTGLGLSICYGIVKEHGGEIYAINVQPAGARVVMELPISAAVRVAAG